MVPRGGVPGDVPAQGMRFGEVAEVPHVAGVENADGAVGAAAEHQLLGQAQAGGQRRLGGEAAFWGVWGGQWWSWVMVGSMILRDCYN